VLASLFLLSKSLFVSSCFNGVLKNFIDPRDLKWLNNQSSTNFYMNSTSRWPMKETPTLPLKEHQEALQVEEEVLQENEYERSHLPI